MDLACQYQKEQGKGKGIMFLEPVLFFFLMNIRTCSFLQGRHWLIHILGEFIGIIQDVPFIVHQQFHLNDIDVQ